MLSEQESPKHKFENELFLIASMSVNLWPRACLDTRGNHGDQAYAITWPKANAGVRSADARRESHSVEYATGAT
eukprot:641589-Amphidinium_carterae.1